MAEKINKPKKYTKEWFHYLWDYYKIHFFVICALIILMIVTVVDVLNTVHYDMNINYIATDVFPVQFEQNMIDYSVETIVDIHDDGEKNTSFSQLNYTNDVMQDGNQISALENKRMALLVSDDQMLYIFDEYMLRDSLSMPMAEGIFIPANEWLSDENRGAKLYEYGDGIYAASLKNSKFLKEIGVDSSNMYIAIRINLSPEDAELEKHFQNCVTFANKLLLK